MKEDDGIHQYFPLFDAISVAFCSISPGVISARQGKESQVGLPRHGEQARFFDTLTARGETGAVSRISEPPKIKTAGTSIPAARCIGPVSPPMTTSQDGSQRCYND
jgi:hypothetical protein